jgi:hypothetical protein
VPARRIVLSEAIANADHVVRATLTTKRGIKIKGIVCGIFVPKRLTDPIKLRFQPSPTQANKIDLAMAASGFSELSMAAILRYGGQRLTFNSDRIWCTPISTGNSYDIQYVSDFSGTAQDLRKITFGIDAPARGRGTFRLTANGLINTAMIVIPSYTGSVKVRWARKPRFSLRNGVKLTFMNHFLYEENDAGERVSFSELVAEFRMTKGVPAMDSVIGDLDDFLLMTSFASRHRCVCPGWTYTDPRGNIVETYRRDLALPKERRSSRDDLLIEMKDFSKFMRTAYRNFRDLIHKRQLARAIYPLINDAEKTTEMSYFSLFSALESALLFADKTFNLFPRGHQRLHERWRLFTARFAVNVSDLWPLTDSAGGVTLTELRNKVGHGEDLSLAQTEALMYAREHVRWTTERVILTLLKWPVQNSRVRPSSLGYTYPYRNWVGRRAAF